MNTQGDSGGRVENTLGSTGLFRANPQKKVSYMARIESDREDLFAEAVGLVRRLEGQIDPAQPNIVVGFRPDQTLVMYLSPDHMYQFDTAGRLRRAFVEGRLYRAQGQTLACLTRVRNQWETVLCRQDLEEQECAAFHAEVQKAIHHFREVLHSDRWHVSRRYPVDDVELEADLDTRLAQFLTASEWIAPPIKGRR